MMTTVVADRESMPAALVGTAAEKPGEGLVELADHSVVPVGLVEVVDTAGGLAGAARLASGVLTERPAQVARVAGPMLDQQRLERVERLARAAKPVVAAEQLGQVSVMAIELAALAQQLAGMAGARAVVPGSSVHLLVAAAEHKDLPLEQLELAAAEKLGLVELGSGQRLALAQPEVLERPVVA